MPKPDTQLWRNIALLFLSKFVTSTSQTFNKTDLINSKNIGLAAKFAAMLGTEPEVAEVRQCLNKAVKQLENEGVLLRTKTGSRYLSTEGITTMNAERERAMAKIAANFPGSVPQGQAKETSDDSQDFN